MTDSDARPPRMLTPDALSAARARLVAELESASSYGDTEILDTIRALEELVCVATAAQAHLARELDASQRSAHAERGLPVAQHGCGVAAQIAWARRESPHRGQRHLALAKVVATELPHTGRAWREGRITEWKATLIARETACLSRDDRRAVDEIVCGDPTQVEALGERQLVAQLQAEAHRLDPESVVARRRLAEQQRHVSLRPAPDAMTWLTALLPVTQGVAVLATLDRAATSARADGDERSRGQVMADALVARVTERAGSDLPAPAPVTLNLVMTDSTLLGVVDEPAHLDTLGPIPAELAREVMAEALSAEEETFVRRLFTSPSTGELVAMDSRRRLFPASLARLIRLRDQTCRTPWCDAPIRHIDHAEDHAVGGATAVANGQGLCQACNHAKQAPGWRARPGPDPARHEIVTTLPSGHTYRTRPPVLATIRRLPLRLEFVLAG